MVENGINLGGASKQNALFSYKCAPKIAPMPLLSRIGSVRVIHIVRMHKEGGEGSSQMRTIVYMEGRGFEGCVRTQKNLFLDHKISNLFLLCTKETITLQFIIMYRKM